MAYFLFDSFMFLSNLFKVLIDWDDCTEYLYFKPFEYFYNNYRDTCTFVTITNMHLSQKTK